MGRRAKPAKVKAKAKRLLVRKPPKDDAARVRDLEKRLAESLAELQDKNRALTEALDTQTATSDICASSAARKPTSNRCSTRSWTAPSACYGRTRAR
jgi:hypothetical protein